MRVRFIICIYLAIVISQIILTVLYVPQKDSVSHTKRLILKGQQENTRTGQKSELNMYIHDMDQLANDAPGKLNGYLFCLLMSVLCCLRR